MAAAHRIAVGILTLVTTCSVSHAAEDWPKWLGPRGDNISKEEISSKWPAEGPKRVWSVQTGDGYASPIARDGKIYLFSFDNHAEETLTTFDAKTGDVLWKQSYSVDEKPQYEGTRATPSIDGDRIYTLGQSGDLVCREIADGKEVWRVNVLKETGAKMLRWGCASSPLVVDNRIFVQTGEGGPIAVAVNKETGKIDWKSEPKTLAGYASLTYAEVKGKPQLFIFAGKALGALDPETGKTIWSDDFETQYDVNATTPVYHDGRVLFTAEYRNGRAAAYDVTNKSYKKVWETKDLRSRFQPIVLDDGYVYGNSGGSLVCVDWKTGKLMWDVKDRAMGLGVGGSIVRAGGDKLVTLSERGKLSLVSATPKGYDLLGQVQLFDAQQVWASPLVYDGKLYCKGRDELVCLDVSAGK